MMRDMASKRPVWPCATGVVYLRVFSSAAWSPTLRSQTSVLSATAAMHKQDNQSRELMLAGSSLQNRVSQGSLLGAQLSNIATPRLILTARRFMPGVQRAYAVMHARAASSSGPPSSRLSSLLAQHSELHLA